MSFSSKDRQRLFLELASSAKGVTVQDIYEEGRKLGDDVSIEAYHNIGRRLSHNALVKVDKLPGERRLYFALDLDKDATWVDEDDLRSIVDPDYPLEAVAVWRESLRQINHVSDGMWEEARARLMQADARQLFFETIVAEITNLKDEIESFAEEKKIAPNAPGLADQRKAIDDSIRLLTRWCKHGLGLSRQAVSIPLSADFAIEMLQKNSQDDGYCKCDIKVLADEIGRRIEPGTFIQQAIMPAMDLEMVVAGVDGATKGGLFSFDDANAVYRQPQISVNTAVGFLNRNMKIGKKETPIFHRLPEKPEDMQRDSNRYSIMAKMFYPDLTESEYMHSNWNALNLLQFRAMLNVMRRWTLDGKYEQAPADVVLRDGPIVPQDRDHYHYGQQDSYGRIVRDLIGVSRDIVTCCEKQGQTVLGVVQDSQMQVLAPVINHFLCQLRVKEPQTRFKAWHKHEMNHLYDQALVSRLLSAGRKPSDPPLRTTLVLRPFHAVSKILAETYSSVEGERPTDKLLKLKKDAQDTFDRGDAALLTPQDDWWRKLRDPGDPYLEMLRNVWYAGFYLGSFPQGDHSLSLPRFEFIVPYPTGEQGEYPNDICTKHLERGLKALETVGFELTASSSLFAASDKIDVLPYTLVRAREAVQIVATHLKNQIGDYLNDLLRARMTGKAFMKPWPRKELKEWAKILQKDRNKKAGS